MSVTTDLEVEGKTVRVSHLEKIFYPETGFTKGDLIHYYVRISPALLPHLKGRALTLKRYPNGVENEFFYEKSCPSHRPDWVQTQAIRRKSKDDYIDFCVINDLPSLVWTANLADVELHTSLALAQQARPSHDDGLRSGPRPSGRHRALLARRPMAAGSACGARTAVLCEDLWLQRPADLCPAEYTDDFRRHQDSSRTRSRSAWSSAHPEEIVSRMLKKLRPGKVLIDWSQNDDHKTTVCVYSLRARSRPTASTPVTWEEVEKCLEKKDPERLTFESEQVIERVQKHGDLFAPVLELKQKLPQVEVLGVNDT